MFKNGGNFVICEHLLCHLPREHRKYVKAILEEHREGRRGMLKHINQNKNLWRIFGEHVENAERERSWNVEFVAY